MLPPGVILAQREPSFRASARLVVAPATVTGPDGKLADGLKDSEFQVLDHGTPVRFQTDGAIQPVALVAVVQTSANAAAALTKVRRVGAMIETLLTGDRGRAALVTFDDRARTVVDFEAGGGMLIRATRELRPMGGGSRLIDGVDRAIRLIENGPQNHRPVILLISEQRDRSSESKLEDVVTRAQRLNILIYSLSFSPFLSQMTVTTHEVPPPPMNLLAIFTELRQAAKESAADALARYTGGRRIPFTRHEALESAITAVGEELHGQYLFSFTPAEGAVGEFRRIEVRVPGRPDLRVRTRPGYWRTDP